MLLRMLDTTTIQFDYIFSQLTQHFHSRIMTKWDDSWNIKTNLDSISVEKIFHFLNWPFTTLNQDLPTKIPRPFPRRSMQLSQSVHRQTCIHAPSNATCLKDECGDFREQRRRPEKCLTPRVYWSPRLFFPRPETGDLAALTDKSGNSSALGGIAPPKDLAQVTRYSTRIPIYCVRHSAVAPSRQQRLELNRPENPEFRLLVMVDGTSSALVAMPTGFDSVRYKSKLWIDFLFPPFLEKCNKYFED